MRMRQQPVMQPVPSGHSAGSIPYWPHAIRPPGQVYGVPPSGVHSGGSVGLPTQISQVPQGTMHWVTCVQVGHLAGLLKSAAVQVGTSRIGVVAPGTLQQPKQSQPFGTSLRQLSMHFCDCDDDNEHSLACCVAYAWS